MITLLANMLRVLLRMRSADLVSRFTQRPAVGYRPSLMRRTRQPHFKFAFVNITPTLLSKKIETCVTGCVRVRACQHEPGKPRIVRHLSASRCRLNPRSDARREAPQIARRRPAMVNTAA